jgi:hypothetical protein
MASENSSLLNSDSRTKRDTTYVEHSDSFVKGETTHHKAFVVFLVCIIISVIALGLCVIYGVSPPKNDNRSIKKDDTQANGQLKLLNSLFHLGVEMESGCECTILLMRHCEKNIDGVVHHHGNNYCSWLGRERSYFLPSLFDPNSTLRRWPVPTHIFALTQERSARYEAGQDQDNGNPNYREIENIMPLANKFGVKVEIYPFNGEVLATDFFSLLQSGEMCGTVSVISWKHELIPDLALTLACGPGDGCPTEYPDDTFDEVWQIKYVLDPQGKAKTSRDPMTLSVQTQGPLTIYEPEKKNKPPVEGGDNDDGNSATSKAPRKELRLRERQLKKNKDKAEDRKKWVVYGSKTFQYFDPLQFSLQSGDYPPGGSPSGGKWADEI